MKLNPRTSVFCSSCPNRNLKLPPEPAFNIIPTQKTNNNLKTSVITTVPRLRVSDTKRVSLF